MPETVAEVAQRIGLPLDKVADLIELPEVSAALIFAGESPEAAPERIWALAELPVIDPDGVDIERLEWRLDAARRLAQKGDGSQVPVGQAARASAMRRAKEVAERRLQVIEEVHALMTNHYAEPQSMEKVKKLLRDELKRSMR